MFVKSYEILSFSLNMTETFGKNISRNLSGKYSQKPLDHAKQRSTSKTTTKKNQLNKQPKKLII